MGSMEDERTFSTLAFTKTRLENNLCEHLHLVVHMHAHPFYTMGTFPYDNAIIARIKEKTQKGFGLRVGIYFGYYSQAQCFPSL
jgi:hypothetical protein